jgi:hypothetical protein
MSEGKVQILICNRCKHKSPAVLNEKAGVNYVRCHGCRTSQRDSLLKHLENEAPEHHTARLQKLSDRYQTDEAFRQSKIDRAMTNKQKTENETPEHRTARLQKLSDRYHTDEAFRQSKIDRAMTCRQIDSECSVCLKKLKRGSLLAHSKICKGKREPTVLEKILLLG